MTDGGPPRMARYVALAVLPLASLVAGACLVGVGVRVVLAALRAQSAGEALRLVLGNPTALWGVGAWLVAGLAWAGARPWRRTRLVLALLPALAPVGAALLVILAGGDRVIRWADLPLPVILSEHGALAYAPGLETRRCRGQGWCGTIRINEHGFRTRDFAWDAEPGTRRVLTLGDSFVFGSGIEQDETLAVCLERELAKDVGEAGRPEVLNLGMPGLSFHGTARMLETLAPRLRPDAVVLGFLYTNDMEPEDQWERFEALGSTLVVLAALTGADRDLFQVEYRRHEAWAEADDVSKIPESIRADFCNDIAKVRHLQDQFGFDVVVLAYFGDHGVFECAAGSAAFRVWSPPRGLFEQDGMLIPGDGHPTGRANAAFARHLAPLLDPAQEE